MCDCVPVSGCVDMCNLTKLLCPFFCCKDSEELSHADTRAAVCVEGEGS